MRYNSKISSLKNKGICILKNIYSKNETTKFKKKLELVYKKRLKNKGSVGSSSNQLLYNYFYEDKSLLDLIYNEKIHQILEKVLDKDYVLQSTNAQNRVYKKTGSKKGEEIGGTWHTDSRYLGGRRLFKGFSYLVIIALDPFTKSNGATRYIPNSFNNLKKPERRLSPKYEKLSKEIIMDSGSVCIMDSGMWHKAGKSTFSSRWSIFSIYTGWFVKPYYDCRKLKNIKKVFKKLLHQYSTPPELSDKYKSTLTEYKHSK